MIEAFISKSTSCIAGDCHKELTDHDNSSYKPEMKSPDRQADRHTDKQTTLISPLVHVPRVNGMVLIVW